MALQEVCESTLVGFFENTNLACIHGKHMTIQAHDMFIAHWLLSLGGYTSVLESLLTPGKV